METGGMKTALSAVALTLSLALAGCGGSSSGGMDNTRIEMQNIDGLVSTASAAVAKLKGDGVTDANVRDAESAVQAANKAVAANEHLSDADEQRYKNAIAALDQTVDLASDRLAAEKRADQAENEKQQADAAKQKAETEKQQADAAKQQAEAEKARAEAARRQAEEDEREAQRQLAQKQAAEDLADAKALFAAAGAGGGRWSLSSSTLTVEATQGKPATVELDGDSLNEMPKSTVSRLSGSNGWSGTRVSAPGDTEGSADTVVAYTNIGAPTRTPFTDRYSNLDPTEDDNSPLVAGSGFKRGNDRVNLAEGKEGISSDNPLKVSGTFAGVSGTYSCTTDPCYSQIGPGDKGVKLTGTWTFTPANPKATVSVQATDYSYFGWWLKEAPEDTFAVQVFHEPESREVTPAVTLTGTADYVGPAVGQYAMLQDGGGTTHVGGSFTATARLKADFDETDNKVTGKITGFRGDPSNSSMSSWEVRLDSSDATSAIWYVGDNKRTADGGGDFDHAFRNAPNASGTPMALTGTWQTSHQLDLDGTPQTTGHMIGAFGATKQ